MDATIDVKEMEKCPHGSLCTTNEANWQVLRFDGTLVLITITSSGTVDNPELTVELTGEITTSEKHLIEDLVASIFNLTLDLTAFYDAVGNDKIMATLTRHLRGLKSPTTPTVFEALVDSIIEQLRNCGLSMRKAEYIHGIANSITEDELDLELFKTYDDPEEIIKEMTKIRGIGVWTAELTMLRGMQKLEAIPADDLGLRRHIAHYYCNDRKIAGAEARTIAEKWGRWRGLAGYYLVVAGRVGLELQDSAYEESCAIQTKIVI